MQEVVRIVLPAGEERSGDDFGIPPGIGVARVEVVVSVVPDEEGSVAIDLQRSVAEVVISVLVLNDSCHDADQPGLDAAAAPRIELSGTEMLVLKYIVGGMTNHDIRTRMTISPKTLETHITNIYSSLRSVGILPLQPSAEDRSVVIHAARHNRFRIVPRLPRRRFR